MRKFISFVDKVYGENCLQLKFVPALIGAFAKLRNATVGFVMTVCPPVCTENLGLHWTHFRTILYLNIFGKHVKKIRASLKV